MPRERPGVFQPPEVIPPTIQIVKILVSSVPTPVIYKIELR